MIANKEDCEIGPTYLGDCRWEFGDYLGNIYVVEGPDEESAWEEVFAGNFKHDGD